MKHRTLPALAAIAVLAIATGASANMYNHEDGTRMKKSRACTNMIDNSASAGVVHKGGANSAKSVHELTFDTCMPVSASNRYSRDRNYSDRDRDYSYANDEAPANMKPASGRYDSRYDTRYDTRSERAERAAERAAERDANRGY